MSEKREVFISYSDRDRGLAEKLIKELNTHRISTSSVDKSLKAGTDWQHEIKHAIKSADAAVILIGPGREPSAYQQLEWSTLLEAKWEDPNKRLIPVLFGDAELPSFLSDRQALRVKDPKEWKKLAEKLVHFLKGDPTYSNRLVSFKVEKEDPSKRRDRLEYIEKTAQALKNLDPNGNEK